MTMSLYTVKISTYESLIISQQSAPLSCNYLDLAHLEEVFAEDELIKMIMENEKVVWQDESHYL